MGPIVARDASFGCSAVLYFPATSSRGDLKLFAICPGFGPPEADNKERILRGNIAVLRAFAPDALIRVCCYAPGCALPADIASEVQQVNEPGIVGQFLMKHAHPEELAALGMTHVAIFLDDVELLPGVDLGLMLEVTQQLDAQIASPLLSPHMPSPWRYMNHQPDEPAGTAFRSSACELFFMLMSQPSYARYYAGLDAGAPWCWGVDLTLQLVRGLRSVLFNDMQVRHWYSGGGARSVEHPAAAEEERYLARRGWTKQSLLAAQRFEVFRYKVQGGAG